MLRVSREEGEDTIEMIISLRHKRNPFKHAEINIRDVLSELRIEADALRNINFEYLIKVFALEKTEENFSNINETEVCKLKAFLISFLLTSRQICKVFLC